MILHNGYNVIAHKFENAVGKMFFLDLNRFILHAMSHHSREILHLHPLLYSTLFKEGKYVDLVRVCIMELLTNGVPVRFHNFSLEESKREERDRKVLDICRELGARGGSLFLIIDHCVKHYTTVTS